jgi:hypothetical protein
MEQDGDRDRDRQHRDESAGERAFVGLPVAPAQAQVGHVQAQTVDDRQEGDPGVGGLHHPALGPRQQVREQRREQEVERLAQDGREPVDGRLAREAAQLPEHAAHTNKIRRESRLLNTKAPRNQDKRPGRRFLVDNHIQRRRDNIVLLESWSVPRAWCLGV